MRRRLLACLVCLSLGALPVGAMARGAGHRSHGGASHSHSSGTHHSSRSGSHGSAHGATHAVGVPRDSHGRIKRSSEARAQFKRAHPCPATGKRSGACPGYVIDHVTALKRSGADAPSNMQWQTREAARAKDKIE